LLWCCDLQRCAYEPGALVVHDVRADLAYELGLPKAVQHVILDLRIRVQGKLHSFDILDQQIRMQGLSHGFEHIPWQVWAGAECLHIISIAIAPEPMP
jgi:hypothetical protein